MTKPNILIICPFFRPNLGGVETHLDTLTGYLVQNNFNVVILTYKPLTIESTYLPFEKKNHLEIHRYWWVGLGLFDKTTPYPFLQFLYIVPKLLINTFFYLLFNHSRIDVIHAHGFAAAFITRIVCLVFPKKKIVSTHFIYQNLGSGFYSRLFHWVFSDFDKILAISESSKKELISIGIDCNKMSIFRHWLNENKFKPSDKKISRTLLSLSKTSLIILYIGRIIKMKGVFQLLSASKKLNDIEFIIVGDGVDYQKLFQQSKTINKFHLIGRISHDQIDKYISACDLLILPSQEPEAQPYVIMESLLCGRPVVTTNMGGVVDMFDSTVGVKINPTVPNIIKTLSYFKNNPSQLTKLSKNCRSYALKHYGIVNADTIINSYYD